jgi:hypothetical protein
VRTSTAFTLPASYIGAVVTAPSNNGGTSAGTAGTIASYNGSNHTITLTAPWSDGQPRNGTRITIWPPNPRTFLSIQDALETAAGSQTTLMPDPGSPIPGQAGITQPLVVVYPANASAFTPIGKYYENIVMHSPAKIQGVGPGGNYADGTTVPGTRLDASFFWSTNSLPDAAGEVQGTELGGNEPYAAKWITMVENILTAGPEGNSEIGWDGNRSIIVGQAAWVLAKASGAHSYSRSYPAAIDGMYVSGGDQKDFPANFNEAFGLRSTVLNEGGNGADFAGILPTQGGGVFVNAYATAFHVSNDTIQGNSGTYGGAIRVGTPYNNTAPANPPNHGPGLDDERDQVNQDVVIANNRVIGNGGTNLAGAIGLFNGTIGYRVTQNTICGNYSIEYGGGISHAGISSVASSGQPTISGSGGSDAAMHMIPSQLVGEKVTALNATGQPTTGVVASNTATAFTLAGAWDNGAPAAGTLANPNPFYIGVGSIDHNRIFMNSSNDEGAGIMISGELPLAGNPGGGSTAFLNEPLGSAPFPGGLSAGAGAVSVDSNMIASNIADDDGGGMRYLSAGAAPQKVTNNQITNNVSAHEGGGISIDDAPHVFIDRNTIARNVTTATAVTSNGAPAPAGISTAQNSNLLQATLGIGAPTFSNPTITNDVIWDNRAGSWSTGGVAGIGLPGDVTPLNVWDIGTADGSGVLTPQTSLIDIPVNVVEGCTGCAAGNPNGAGNWVGVSPNFTAPFVTQVEVLAIRTYFRYKPSGIININEPADAFGNYTTPFNVSPGIGAVIPGGLQ